MISLNQEHKILVVDDEMANLQKLQRTFVNRYPVLVASSGREALQFVEKESDIAVIVADQRMPDMTGIDFLRQTLEPLPHAIRIITAMSLSFSRSEEHTSELQSHHD